MASPGSWSRSGSPATGYHRVSGGEWSRITDILWITNPEGRLMSKLDQDRFHWGPLTPHEHDQEHPGYALLAFWGLLALALCVGVVAGSLL
jgi:hypothetical protein